MKQDECRRFSDMYPEPDNVGGIPIIDPVSMGEVSYIKDRVDEIHLYAGLSELRQDMLESMREWLQEILDNWPNRAPEESSGTDTNSRLY